MLFKNLHIGYDDGSQIQLAFEVPSLILYLSIHPPIHPSVCPSIHSSVHPFIMHASSVLNQDEFQQIRKRVLKR